MEPEDNENENENESSLDMFESDVDSEIGGYSSEDDGDSAGDSAAEGDSE